MAQFRREDAGNTGATFYKVTMEPADWYKWFRKQENKPENSVESKDDSDSDWTKVHIHVCMVCESKVNMTSPGTSNFGNNSIITFSPHFK